jgi:hypothetical protein
VVETDLGGTDLAEVVGDTVQVVEWVVVPGAVVVPDEASVVAEEQVVDDTVQELAEVADEIHRRRYRVGAEVGDEIRRRYFRRLDFRHHLGDRRLDLVQAQKIRTTLQILRNTSRFLSIS